MNKKRRNFISSAITYLEYAADIIESAKNEEEDAFYNLPESFQCSERGILMEDTISKLEELIDSVREAIDIITEITES